MRVVLLGFPVDSVTRLEAMTIWVRVVTLGRRQSTIAIEPGFMDCIPPGKRFTGASK